MQSVEGRAVLGTNGGRPAPSTESRPRSQQFADTGVRSVPETEGGSRKPVQQLGLNGVGASTQSSPRVPQLGTNGALRPGGTVPAPGVLQTLLRDRFGFSSFRPHQRAVCEAAAGGKDVLLVMPTGAGKSLCYQLPGLARAGTTLVVSPLIALMEDQVTRLQSLGLAAARIHSGRERTECSSPHFPSGA